MEASAKYRDALRRLSMTLSNAYLPRTFLMMERAVSKLLSRTLCSGIICAASAITTPDVALAQAPSADSLARWVRGGYSLTVDSGQAPRIAEQVREVWGQLGWSGVGYGFRTFAVRQPTDLPSMDAFAAMMEYYRITLDELHTEVDGDIGLVWGIHSEEFKVRGQPPDTVRVRFTSTLRWDGTRWKNLLYHRDAQIFDENGRYSRRTGASTTPGRAVGRGDSALVAPIEVRSAGATLRGKVYVAAGPGPHATVVHLQGFPGGPSTELERYFQRQGFNVVSVHVRGQQTSDGLYTIRGIPDDARAVVAFLRTDSARRILRIDSSRIALIGVSAGSFGALRATAADSSLRCVAIIVPFNWALTGYAARRDTALARRYRSAMDAITGRTNPPVRLDTSFATTVVRDAELHDLRRAAASLGGRKVLFVGAANDQTAPPAEHFWPLVDAARAAPGSMVRDTVVTDTHALPATSMQVFATTAAWLRSDCGS